MNNDNILATIQRFEMISRNLAKKWGKPEAWEDIYSDMCCAFIKKGHRLANKPFGYIIKACKNEAINNYLSGKSVCSRPRDGLTIISIESICESLPTERRFETQVHIKILVEDLFNLLSRREKQVAMLIMYGYTEKETAEQLHVSQQRVNRIKQGIRNKAIRVMRKKVVI